MKLSYIIPISFRNVIGAKTRSLLTIMATSIGFATIVFLLTAGYGVQNVVTSESQTKDMLNVFDVSLENSEQTKITKDDLKKIKSNSGVSKSEPAVLLPGKLINNQVSKDIIIKGISEEYFELEGKKIKEGSALKNSDAKGILISQGALDAINNTNNKTNSLNLTAEAIINQDLAPNLSDNMVSLKNLKITGVIDDKNSYIAVSLKNLQTNFELENYNVVKVKAENKENVVDLRKNIENLGFSTTYVGDTITQINNLFKIFRYVIGTFGVIAAFVAIIGMVNTLIVSLIERTQEIGILKANGARRKDIWLLFISESAILSLSGGLAGIVFGVFLAEFTNLVFNIYATKNGGTSVHLFSYPLSLFLYLIIASVFTGFITGLYPAARASKIKILDAIKYE